MPRPRSSWFFGSATRCAERLCLSVAVIQYYSGGYASPLEAEAEPQKKNQARRKAIGFPHIKRHSRACFYLGKKEFYVFA